MTRIDAASTTANPIEGVTLHILVPIVSITFFPYNTNPKQIPIAPQVKIIILSSGISRWRGVCKLQNNKTIIQKCQPFLNNDVIRYVI